MTEPTQPAITSHVTVGPIRLLGVISSGAILVASVGSVPITSGIPPSLAILTAWTIGGILGAKWRFLRAFFFRNYPRQLSTTPSWTNAFWGCSVAVAGMTATFVPAVEWNQVFWALSISICVSYAAARIGCGITGCCWQTRRSRLLRIALQLFGGPLPVCEARFHLAVVAIAIVASEFVEVETVALGVLSIHAWSKFVADLNRGGKNRKVFAKLLPTCLVQLWVLFLYATVS